MSKPWVGFETTIAAGERPKTYALDRAATGTGTRYAPCAPKFHNFCICTIIFLLLQSRHKQNIFQLLFQGHHPTDSSLVLQAFIWYFELLSEVRIFMEKFSFLSIFHLFLFSDIFFCMYVSCSFLFACGPGNGETTLVATFSEQVTGWWRSASGTWRLRELH